MITQTGEVLEWRSGQARVRVERFVGCGQCHLRHGCGAGVLARMLPGRVLEVSLPAERPLQPGDRVTLGMHESALLRAAAIVYLMPVVALVAGAVLLAPGGDVASAAGGGAGLAAGIAVARGIAAGTGRDAGCGPVLLDGNGNGCRAQRSIIGKQGHDA